ncbi:hypothetical protein EQO05_01420 [Methanosarcina sp. MSH10X1]|uniref:hypothetical protein n=1 Tax=Methanosarcina sp. MSH10X1 TaxID=2507075 RepID=UPI000FFBC3AA|nr:hypothetical protein [Methanosarcina sp. MSH10X1]RXA21914.1 hypothetical protein EQO05_01420 [Methanosarcina sp. MSH10X1]
MEDGKIKNTITRSFELQDYRIEGTELSGFWADLTSKEELIVEVNYSPENKKAFSPEEIEKLVLKIREKCGSFEAQLPENIKCEVTFKNLGEKVYKAGQADFELELGELEEVQVTYRFYVEYFI